jgi:hypothetical protein
MHFDDDDDDDDDDGVVGAVGGSTWTKNTRSAPALDRVA